MVSLNDIFIIVGMIAGASVAAFIIWNSSKKIANLEFQLISQKERFSKDLESSNLRFEEEISKLKETRHELIVEYNDRLTTNVRSLTKDISDAKVERKEDIQKAINIDKEGLSALQRQLDSAKSDIKDVAARVIIVNTKIEHVEKDIVSLRECDTEVKKFFTDWNQRIEDRVEAVRSELVNFRKEFIHMFTAFHSPKNGNGHEIE